MPSISHYVLACLCVVAVCNLQVVSSSVYYVSPSPLTDGGSASCPEDSSCHSLSYYANNSYLFSSDSVFYFLEGEHSLKEPEMLFISGVSNLTLRGLGQTEQGFHDIVIQTTVKVTCVTGSGGVAIVDCGTVYVSGLTISGCSSRIPLAVQKAYFFALSSSYVVNENLLSAFFYRRMNFTLLFASVEELHMTQVSLQNCSELCLLAIAVTNASLDEFYTANSNVLPADGSRSDSEEEQTGGGVWGSNVLLYVDSTDCSETDPFSYTLRITNSCVAFSGLVCSSLLTVGGLYVYQMSHFPLNVELDSVVAYRNMGGNVVFIVSNARIFVTNLTTSHANAQCLSHVPHQGGFLMSVYTQFMCAAFTEDVSNSLVIRDSTFSHNVALSGAGLLLDGSFAGGHLLVSAEIINCHFYMNSATSSSALKVIKLPSQPLDMEILIKDSVFTDNLMLPVGTHHSMQQSSVDILFVQSAILSNITISNHPFTGLIASGTWIRFHGNNTFSNNSGTLGGGMALLHDSRMFLSSPVNLNFVSNSAIMGGGIYSMDRNEFVSDLSCFYQIADPFNVSMISMQFSGNKAEVTGSQVYGSIQDCFLFIPTLVRKNDLLWQLFGYNSSRTDDDPYRLSSEAVTLCPCVEGRPLCSQSAANETATAPIFPGEAAIASVVAVGDVQGLTESYIRIAVNVNNRAPYFLYSMTPARCYEVTIPIRANDSDKVTVMLDIDDPLYPSLSQAVTYDVPILPCPPGFMLNESNVCACDSEISAIDDTTCNISSLLISHPGNSWVGYDTDYNCTIAISGCPDGYCASADVTFDILYPDKQCDGNRTGTVCSSCVEGHSLGFGSNQCEVCSNSYLALILPFALAGFLLIGYLMILDQTTTLGTINGLIFYANVMQIMKPHAFDDDFVPVLNQFISWFNLNLGTKICFFEGMTIYERTWLQFVFPLYIWLLMLAIILACRYSDLLSALVGSRALSVLVTLSLLSYNKLIITILVILRLDTFTCHTSTGDVHFTVWKEHAGWAYLNWRHSLLFAAGMLALVGYIVPLTLFLLLSPFLPLCNSNKSWLMKKLLSLKPVYDAFSGAYGDKCRWWTGFLLLVRIMLVMSASFGSRLTTLFVVVISTSVLLSMTSVLRGVYRMWYNNLLETWFLFQLVFVSSMSLIGFSYVGGIISLSLSLMVYVGITVLHCYWQCKKFSIRCCSNFPRYNNSMLEKKDLSSPINAEDISQNDSLRRRKFTLIRILSMSRFRDSVLGIVEEMGAHEEKV